MSADPDTFHHDGGAELYSKAEAYAKRLREDCSILRNPETQRFHVIRPYDVARRVKELGWVLCATITWVASIELHLPSDQL